MKNNNLNRVIVSRGNMAFYMAAMVTEMQSIAFEDALYRGQHQPVVYSFMHAGYPCRMVVNAVALRELPEAAFLSGLRKAVSDAIGRVPLGMRGDLNEKVQFESGQYRFEFSITGYWCAKSPEDFFVEDPSQLPMGEELGRQVELRISFAV